MNKYGLNFHHLGLAVKQPEKAVNFLTGLGYAIGRAVRDDRQNVNLIFCTNQAMPVIEIIAEAETPGPLAGILKLNTAMIYHVCFESECLAESLAAIKRDNHQVTTISGPKPAVLFSGRNVSFYQIRNFGMVEILEASNPANLQ